tara:strand:- start:305 stop:847 length:543 start_codon:yes stop_codon:yes gene_type:complete
MISLKQTIRDIKGDLPVTNILLGKIFLRNYFFSPRFRLLLNHRLGKYFFNKGGFFLNAIALYYKNKMIVRRNCDISYNASLGKNLRLPHPIGIVIGDGVIIEDDVMIFQQVTFGSHGKKEIKAKEYPIIKSGVKIFAGAKIIGGITIGENAVIGANSVVNIDIPPNTIAVGVPCRIIKKA